MVFVYLPELLLDISEILLQKISRYLFGIVNLESSEKQRKGQVFEHKWAETTRGSKHPGSPSVQEEGGPEDETGWASDVLETGVEDGAKEESVAVGQVGGVLELLGAVLAEEAQGSGWVGLDGSLEVLVGGDRGVHDWCNKCTDQ